jgi:hypothetical protein
MRDATVRRDVAVNAGGYSRNVRVRPVEIIDENSVGRECGFANQGGRSVTFVELTL